MQVDPSVFEQLPPDQAELLKGLLAEYQNLLALNPLEGFHACATPCGMPGCEARAKQHEFMASMNRIVAAFAGNRFGKTVAQVVWALVQHTPDDMLPDRLKVFKRPRPEHIQGLPVVGRYLLPSQRTIQTIVMPEFWRWTPPSLLKGHSWTKAYSTQHNIISFEDGGRIEFFTYEQDPRVGVGASLDYVLYDEPPPEDWYHENLPRTTDRAGCHRFGMTPVNMKGEGISWIADEIFDKADEPHITVVRGTIHDNPLLSEEEIAFTLDQFPEDERQAREFGDFIHFGGMIYPGGFERNLATPILPPPDDDPNMDERLRYHDIVVGIDPGLKNAAFVWVAFDEDNRALVFAELLLHDKTPLDYAHAIRKVNSLFRIKTPPLYVIDPSARNRSLTDAESVQMELQRQGIPCAHGQNDVHAGVQQVRRRMQEGGFHIGENLAGLRWEAKRYLMKDDDTGEFKVVKTNDHRLDAMRYALMARPWYPNRVANIKDKVYQPGQAPPLEWYLAQDPVEQGGGPPMGGLS